MKQFVLYLSYLNLILKYLSNYVALPCIINVESIFLYRMEAATQTLHSKWLGNLRNISSP